MKAPPVRQCLGCREHRPKKELVRVVRSPEGAVSLDSSGKKPGRGAYICHNTECLKRVKKSRALERMLKTPLGEDVYAALEIELERNG